MTEAKAPARKRTPKAKALLGADKTPTSKEIQEADAYMSENRGHLHEIRTRRDSQTPDAAADIASIKAIKDPFIKNEAGLEIAWQADGNAAYKTALQNADPAIAAYSQNAAKELAREVASKAPAIAHPAVRMDKLGEHLKAIEFRADSGLFDQAHAEADIASLKSIANPAHKHVAAVQMWNNANDKVTYRATLGKDPEVAAYVEQAVRDEDHEIGAKEERKASDMRAMGSDVQDRVDDMNQVREAAQAPSEADRKTKVAGQALFNIRDVPEEFMAATKQRFGRAGEDMMISPARENGTYKGDVLNGTEFLAQRVGSSSSSVVIHQKANIELVSEKHRWQDKEQKLNGTQMAIYYEGKEAKAYPHDPQREELSKLVNTMKQHAAKLGMDKGEFGKTIEAVKESMLHQLKEREKAQKEQQQRSRPAQEQQRQERQHQARERWDSPNITDTQLSSRSVFQTLPDSIH